MKSLPFRWKLTLLITLISAMNLSLAFVGLYIHDVYAFRAEMQRRLDNTKIVMLDRLTPILEQSPDTADLPLSLLENDKQIVAAAVYSPDNKLLARYTRSGSQEFIPSPNRVRQIFFDDRSIVFTPIRKDSRTYGTLYLKAQLTQADEERVGNLLRGTGIVFLISALVAFGVGYQLQRGISRPITTLAAAARRISEQSDYSVRVKQTASGEIGELIASFNLMLDTVEQRTIETEQARSSAEEAREKIHQINLQLEDANHTLETRVEERTRELASAVKAAEDANTAKSAFLAKMSHELPRHSTPSSATAKFSSRMHRMRATRPPPPTSTRSSPPAVTSSA